jgi:two-component system NarL family sensor kinase
MLRDRKGFQILDGFRHSVLDDRACPLPGMHRDSASVSTHRGKPRKDNLIDSIRGMEQRLSALLEDRTHIGRDLHDGILQSLYAIGLNIEAARREHPQPTPDSEQVHVHTIEQINRLIHDIRQMIHGLDEGVVQDFDLVTELQALKSAYNQIGRMRISLDLHPAAIEVLTKEEEREILCIAREALSNCVRHANATHAAISIRKRGDRIRVQISDDGQGFAMRDGRPRGYGLVNMTARAKKIGGTLQICSKESHGTDIIAEFSLEPVLAPI